PVDAQRARPVPLWGQRHLHTGHRRRKSQAQRQLLAAVHGEDAFLPLKVGRFRRFADCPVPTFLLISRLLRLPNSSFNVRDPRSRLECFLSKSLAFKNKAPEQTPEIGGSR
ncbi:unnamed protein product, partial [Ixodes pacificus]